ncbi:hypothetical protein P389DRAFT_165442 [Cystobasidium minutum MCA 4210]|uniref:uncharacterized protein n=1 Tax=Cystobasidium minutum MCA 4210 TaxID=1397322 RepID=UPI0034CD4C6D|eukprot:jgi/Rhomi1/165442/fgenesh1_kg.1_\
MKALSRTFRSSSGDDKVNAAASDSGASSAFTSSSGVASSGSSVSGASRSSSGSSNDSNNSSSANSKGRSFTSLSSLGSNLSRTLNISPKCVPEDADEEAIMEYLQNSPIPTNPIDFISAAYAPLFNTTAALPKHMQGKYKCKKKRNVPFDMVKEYHVPRYFSENFTCETNGEHKNMDEFLSISEGFHTSEEMKNIRTIERAAVTNKKHRPSMNRASVFFHDESIHRPLGAEDDPIHVHIYSIVTIDKGKIVHDHIVVDQSPLTNRHTDLSCCIQ